MYTTYTHLSTHAEQSIERALVMNVAWCAWAADPQRTKLNRTVNFSMLNTARAVTCHRNSIPSTCGCGCRRLLSWGLDTFFVCAHRRTIERCVSISDYITTTPRLHILRRPICTLSILVLVRNEIVMQGFRYATFVCLCQRAPHFYGAFDARRCLRFATGMALRHVALFARFGR